MKLFALLTIIFSTILSTAQPCHCDSNFLFVKKYIETNSPSFADNVITERQKEYDEFCIQLLNNIKTDNCISNCTTFISTYLKFFRDQHLSIEESNTSISINENDTFALRKFKESVVYTKQEKIFLTAPQIEKLKYAAFGSIEGIYYAMPDTTYTIAMVASGKAYKGIILNSKTKLWDKYQVKLTLTPLNDSVFIADRYMRDFSYKQENTQFKNDGFAELTFYKKKISTPSTNQVYSFQKLNDSINYIKINSFNGSYTAELNRFYKTVDSAIRSMPYLVIDVRNNGGGGDANYDALVPYFYDNPIAGDIVDVFATPDNIKRYEERISLMKKDEASFGKANIIATSIQLSKMKKAKPFSFVPLTNEKMGYRKLSYILPYPKKVIILYNKFCASSCESLLFDAIQSKRVITMGENSGGYTGYGNILPVKIPNSNLLLYCTTTRYREQRKYDGIGITPMVKLNANEDWLKAAIDLIHIH
jgi:Peptidase family S41